MPGVDALAQALSSRVQAAAVCSRPVRAGEGEVMPQLAGRPQDAQGVVLQLLCPAAVLSSNDQIWAGLGPAQLGPAQSDKSSGYSQHVGTACLPRARQLEPCFMLGTLQ